MKRTYKFLLGALLASLFVSCDELTEIEQPGELSPEATFESVSDLNNGLLGAYAELDITTEIQFASVFTDEISIGFDNGGQGLGSEYIFLLNPQTGGPTALWTKNYDAINAATRVIEAAPLVTPGEGEEGDYNSIIGQAHAIRAFAHFTLMTYFTPDLADDNALAVIAVDFVPSVESALPRNTNAEVVALIESDLDQAESLISPSLTDVNFFTLDAITAIRARLAAYRQDYAAADQFATQLLNRYPLASQGEYLDMYRLDTDGEVIFKLQRTVGDRYDGQGSTGSPFAGGWVGANYAFTGPDVDGSPYFEMGRSLFNLFDTDDIRYEVNVSETTVLDPLYPNTPPDDWRESDIIPIDKYRGNVPGEGQPLMNDLKVFRASEMQLIKAEAQVALGNLGAAANLVKELRDARFGSPQPTPSYSNATAAYADILEERRRELCFEGHRYIDLKRLGQRANAGIDRDQLDCQLFGACDAPAPGDFRFTFPIPLVEINGNATIATQQNPGY